MVRADTASEVFCASSFGFLRLLLLGRRLLAQVLVDPRDERSTHISTHPPYLGLWPPTVPSQVRREDLERVGVLTGSREHHRALVHVHEDPATFLVAEAEGQIVGRVSIRHALNAHLAEVGGHIGYGARPGFRRRGYATAIMRQFLAVASPIGLERVLVTFDDDNVGSAKVIENSGGVLENLVAGRDGSVPKRQYWVEIGASLVSPFPGSRCRARDRASSLDSS